MDNQNLSNFAQSGESNHTIRNVVVAILAVVVIAMAILAFVGSDSTKNGNDSAINGGGAEKSPEEKARILEELNSGTQTAPAEKSPEEKARILRELGQ